MLANKEQPMSDAQVQDPGLPRPPLVPPGPMPDVPDYPAPERDDPEEPEPKKKPPPWIMRGCPAVAASPAMDSRRQSAFRRRLRAPGGTRRPGAPITWPSTARGGASSSSSSSSQSSSGSGAG